MLRRDTLVAAPLLATAALLAVACGAPPRPQLGVENAVLICLDTVRYDTLALVRDVLAQDPEASWWRRAVWVTGAQSTAPWTLPAVASVFTGVYPNAHRAGAFPDPVADLRGSFPQPLGPGFPTLATQLAERGFETVGFVAAQSWFGRDFGLTPGFETLDPKLHRWFGIVARVEEWSRRRAEAAPGRPFFLYLHFMDAHLTAHLGPRHLERSIETLPPPFEARAIAAAGPACGTDVRAPSCRRYLAYASAVASQVRGVSRVLSSLDQYGHLERTAVLLFSDHGEEFLEHAREETVRALDPRGSYGEGHGHSLYQELLHVPLVIWHPALEAGERRLRASLVDVAPTLLGWLGIPPDPRYAGLDLGPALAGAASDPQRPLFSSAVAFGPEREAVLRGDWKQITDGRSGAAPLRFEIAEDPGERSPTDGAQVVGESLGELLRDYRNASAPLRRPAAPSPGDLESLQALGYLREAEVE